MACQLLPCETVYGVLVQIMFNCHNPVCQCFALRPPPRDEISGGDMHCSRDCNFVTCAITGIRISAVDVCSKVVVTMLEVRLDTACKLVECKKS